MEEWRDVVGWEGLYQVSSLGRIKSFRRNHPHILSDCVGKHGYKVVILHDGRGLRKNERIHRLVAQAFIPNLEGLPYINHKDEDKTNNKIDNLEWCYYDIEAWGEKLANIIEKCGFKGRGVRVVGRLKQNRWKTTDGKSMAKIVVVAEHV
ncbi:MAG: HNH endonuclease, partial [Alphaproteobacteria bacterium]|nr:HNH endonuclease [Alphaproteobacteria bacterium]